jgi:hypothetical protein
VLEYLTQPVSFFQNASKFEELTLHTKAVHTALGQVSIWNVFL